MTNATACAATDFFIGTGGTTSVATSILIMKLFTSTTRCMQNITLDKTILNAATIGAASTTVTGSYPVWTTPVSWTAGAAPTLYAYPAGFYYTALTSLATSYFPSSGTITTATIVDLSTTTNFFTLQVPQF